MIILILLVALYIFVLVFAWLKITHPCKHDDEVKHVERGVFINHLKHQCRKCGRIVNQDVLAFPQIIHKNE